MVLPASAAHNESGPREASWFDPLKLGLRLSKAAILLHVDHAQPARLGELVRGLAADHPNMDVSADVRAAATVPEGSLLVLIPKAAHADWLNLERPLFARRGLKVVLFCDHETSIALAHNAPDFFDWISQHVDCPPGPALHAVLGLRAALAADAPVLWTSPDKPEDVKRAWSAFSSAFPGQSLRWINAMKDYEEIVADLRSAADGWVACRPRAATHLRRFRWALAEVGRWSRALVATAELPCPGYWPVHDALMPFEEACRMLEGAGAARAGCLAALTGLEPEAVELGRALLGERVPEDRLVDLLRDAEDPGAALAREQHKAGKISPAEVAGRRASPPALRALAGDPAVRQLRKKNLHAVKAMLAKGAAVGLPDLGDFAASCPAPKSMGGFTGDIKVLSFAVECTLRRTPRPATWVHLAEQAFVAGELGAAGVWALRSPEQGRRAPAVLEDISDALSNVHDPRHERLDRELRAKLRRYSAPISFGYWPRDLRVLILCLLGLLFGWIVIRLDSWLFAPRGLRFLLPTILFAPICLVFGFIWLKSWMEERRARRLKASSIAEQGVRRGFYAWRHALNQGDYANAARGLAKLDMEVPRTWGVEHILSRWIRCDYALALLESGNHSEALGVLNGAIALEARIEGVGYHGFTELIPTLADAFTRTGRAVQAEALLRKLLGPEARLPGQSDSQPPAPAEISAGSMSAETDEALALFLAQPGTPRLSVDARVHALRLLAEALHVQGRYEEAEVLLDRAMEHLPQLEPTHREQWRTRASFGAILAVEGRTEEACALLRDAAARASHGAGEHHPDHKRILAELARLE